MRRERNRVSHQTTRSGSDEQAKRVRLDKTVLDLEPVLSKVCWLIHGSLPKPVHLLGAYRRSIPDVKKLLVSAARSMVLPNTPSSGSGVAGKARLYDLISPRALLPPSVRSQWAPDPLPALRPVPCSSPPARP